MLWMSSCASARVGLVFLTLCLIVLHEGVHAQAPRSELLNSGSEQVFFGDDLIFEDYFGKLSVEYNVNFTFNSQFRICSNTKLFTAVSIMQLVDAGKISSIYDNVNKYLNETDMMLWGYPAGTTQWCPMVYNATSSGCQNVTFVSLMSMSAGIIPVITCSYAPSAWQYQYCLTPEWSSIYNGSPQVSLQSFIKNPLLWTPGPTYGPTATSPSTYMYANENFIILSYFIQKLSGMSLQDYYQTMIFDRVGMPNTFYDPLSLAFQTQAGLATEYFYYTDMTQTITPFAIGQCGSVEAKTGTQAGSGGIVSSLPDMIKWYVSLFVAKNASLVSEQSLDLILYPWVLEPVSPGNPYQYYGLGIELLFEDPPLSPPMPVSSAPAPITIYYLGGSTCMFFTLMLYLSDYNIMNPSEPLVSVPMISAVARNNRIMNITQEIWQETQQVPSGTWYTLTDYPYGWGADNSALTDTFFEALDLVLYFAGLQPSAFETSMPTHAPTSNPGCNDDVAGDDSIISSNSNSSADKISISKGVLSVAVIIPCIAVGAATYLFMKVTQDAKDRSVQASASTPSSVNMVPISSTATANPLAGSV
jgi:CubicO group peptidase (beta-lactamase class C family)